MGGTYCARKLVDTADKVQGVKNEKGNYSTEICAHNAQINKLGNSKYRHSSFQTPLEKVPATAHRPMLDPRAAINAEAQALALKEAVAQPGVSRRASYVSPR